MLGHKKAVLGRCIESLNELGLKKKNQSTAIMPLENDELTAAVSLQAKRYHDGDLIVTPYGQFLWPRLGKIIARGLGKESATGLSLVASKWFGSQGICFHPNEPAGAAIEQFQDYARRIILPWFETVGTPIGIYDFLKSSPSGGHFNFQKRVAWKFKEFGLAAAECEVREINKYVSDSELLSDLQVFLDRLK